MQVIKRSLVSLLLIITVLPVFISGCSNAIGNEEENDMDSEASIPQIDLNAPAYTEIATFGLG
jgi:hypothetical protein